MMTVSKNLLGYLERADVDTIEKGLNWYIEANSFAKELSLRSEFNTIDTIAQIISCLSPAVSWELNKKDATNLILSGGSIQTVVSTYGFNKAKAIRILGGEEDLKLHARKTYCFYRNIMLDSGYITIDRHAYKALMGKKKAGSEAITQKRYDTAVTTYMDTAKSVNLKGYELQAIVWLQYKIEMGR